MKKAITENDVEKLAKNGVLEVTKDMVLTPEARIFASRRRIAIRFPRPEPEKVSPPIAQGDLAKLIEQAVVEEVTRQAQARGQPAQVLVPSEPLAPASAVSPAVPPPVSAAAAMEPVGLGALEAQVKEKVLSFTREEVGNRAIVTVIGANRPGIVARISKVVAECGGDLADMSQVIVDQYFSMIFIVNMSGIDEKVTSFRAFKEKLQDEAARIGQVEVLVMHENIFRAMHKV
jgi:ACT domain-containing protein